MKLEFYYNSEIKPFDEPECDNTKVIEACNELNKNGIKCDIIDTAKIAEEQRSKAYIDASMAAVRKGREGYKVRQVFGSRKDSGFLFGKRVPALVVRNDNGHVVDVYPHERYTRKVPINEFLKNVRQ